MIFVPQHDMSERQPTCYVYYCQANRRQKLSLKYSAKMELLDLGFVSVQIKFWLSCHIEQQYGIAQCQYMLSASTAA